MLRVKYLFRTVYTLFFAIVLLCLFSCGGKSVPSDAGVSDTVAADSADSAEIVPADSIMDDAVIPKTADEYFNDKRRKRPQEVGIFLLLHIDIQQQKIFCCLHIAGHQILPAAF